MIPLLVEILVQLLLLAGAAALIFTPLWLFRTRRGSAQPRLLGNSSEHGGVILHGAAPTRRAREAPAVSHRR